MAVQGPVVGSSPALVIAGVTIPGPLVDAIENGSLVVFAGAGISQGPPACWYGFERLAKEMAKGSYVQRRDMDLDVWLGRVEKSDRALECRVRRYFLSKDPETNPPHQAIVRLWPRGVAPRIVTTNYDALFEKADGSLRSWAAPALPRGDDFDGVVHIHGYAHDPRSQLVVTDRDFGRAYLSEAWARDFLLKLYETSPVLFVGYSHDDTITTYLARGLGASGPPKYALWAQGEGADEGRGVHTWDAIGVTPVEFLNESGDFSILNDVLEGLGKYVRQTEFERLDRIGRIAEGGPGEVSDAEASVLRRALVHPSRVRYFTDRAAGLEWLRWLRTEGFLDRLMGRGAAVTPADLQVGYWIAGLAASDDGPAVRALMTEMGGQIDPNVVGMIARKVWFDKESTLERFQNWGAALLRRPVLGESLEALLSKAPKLEAWPLAFAALDEVLRPEIRLKEDFFSAAFAEDLGEEMEHQESDQVEVQTRGAVSFWKVAEVCRQLLAIDAEELQGRLLRVATGHLARGHDLYRAAGEVWSDGDDPWSYTVKEIQPLGDQTGWSDDGKHTLVGLAVSTHDLVAVRSADTAAAVRADWAESGYPILLRLALHCTPTDDGVLALVSAYPVLFKRGSSAEETQAAVLKAYPTASDGEKASIRRVLEREGAKYTFAARTARELGVVLPNGDALAELRTRVRVSPPTDSLADLLDRPPTESAQSIEAVLVDEEGNVPQGDPGRQVADAASAEGWARAMTEHLKSSERWDSPIWRPLFWGMRNAFSGTDWQQAVLRLLAHSPITVAASERAGFVESVVRHGDTDLLEAAGAMLLRAVEDGASGESAVAAVISITRKAREEAPNVDGDRLLGALARLSAERSELRTSMGALARELWEVDEAWTRHNVLPLFEASDLATGLANDAWRGLLEGSAGVDFLPPNLVTELARLLPNHVASIGGTVRTGPELNLGPPLESQCKRAMRALAVPAERAVSLMVRAALLAEEDPYDDWLGRFIYMASAPVRSLWMERIGTRMRSPFSARNVWTRWGKAYLIRRVDGVPEELHPCEVRALFEWMAALPEGAFDEGVQILSEAPSPARPPMDFVRTLNDADTASHSPAAVARLLALALKSGATAGVWSEDLASVAKKVAVDTPEEWQELEDQLLLSASIDISDLMRIRHSQTLR